MPRPLHYGRPGSQVLPTGWAESQAPVISNILAGSGCTITITPPVGAAGSGTTAWNREAKATETTPAAAVYGPDVDPHAGVASITLTAEGPVLDIVDTKPTTTTYEIRLPWDAPAACNAPGSVVRVVTDPDPDLVGKTLIVQQAERDTRRFSRILYATLTN